MHQLPQPAVSYSFGERAQWSPVFSVPSVPAPYRIAGYGTQEVAAWRPPTTSADSAILPGRDLATARMHDVVRNDPHAVAGITRLVDMLVGAGLRLSSKPLMRALGFDPKNQADRAKVRELGQQMEAEWDLFALDPGRRGDAQRKLSTNGQFRLLARTYVRAGEATAYMNWKPSSGGRYATCLRTIDPDRLCNPDGKPDSKNLRGGIEFDDDGVPLAYNVRNGHPADYYRAGDVMTWTRIPRATAWGRPVFIHGFEPDRDDQARAITPFAALLSRLRMIGKFADTELASATVNAMFAAFVKSNLPVAEATQAFTPQSLTFADKRMDYWEKTPPTLGGVRIPVLPLGDEISINSSPRQTTAFPAFQAAFLQSIAAALGISYEQLAMDWSKVNYSSARAALNEVWRHVQTLFAGFVEQVVCPLHYAVMEEAFDRGYVTVPKGAPDFYDMPGAYLRARWIGPGRGYIDPTKEAEASSMRMDSLTSSLERECAEQGLDYEEMLDQLAVEQEELAARSLSRRSLGKSEGVPQPEDPPANAPAPVAA